MSSSAVTFDSDHHQVTAKRKCTTRHQLLPMAATLWLFLLLLPFVKELSAASEETMPRVEENITNVTVTVGSDVLLECVFDNVREFLEARLRFYVIWRGGSTLDTQTILTAYNDVVTQNPRFWLSLNDHLASYHLHIDDVHETDRGWYMCQLYTDPMRMQRVYYLQVVVPPSIVDQETSTDMVVREGANVTLTCKATGYPEPYVRWRREDSKDISYNGESVNVVDGEVLHITNVSRLHMGAYLCIASNGVHQSTSKRVMLSVQFPPVLSIPNQLEGAYIGQDVALECHTEAYPTSINYWTNERGHMIDSGDKYETMSTDNGYNTYMMLKIRGVSRTDFGWYHCVAKNSLGEIYGIIKLDEIPAPSTTTSNSTVTTTVPSVKRKEALMPRFAENITNVTVTVGRDALLACVVDNLRGYKVAWVRVDTQTILSIHHYVITQNPRISLSYNDHRSWYLHIKNVHETDRGWYMCQVNTDPRRMRQGYLQVVVPPSIVGQETSTDMVVREGANVTLTCKATGYPEPYVRWRREDSKDIPSYNGESVNVVDGEVLHITNVSRLHMGAYLCIASNGVHQSTSKRVMLSVQFPPMMSVPNRTYIGQDVVLECYTEAYPTAISYWTNERGYMIDSDFREAGDKYETVYTHNGYNTYTMLKIRGVSRDDFGWYYCVANNSLGRTYYMMKLDGPSPGHGGDSNSTQWGIFIKMVAKFFLFIKKFIQNL